MEDNTTIPMGNSIPRGNADLADNISSGLTHSLRILWDAHVSSDFLSFTLLVPVSFT